MKRVGEEHLKMYSIVESGVLLIRNIIVNTVNPLKYMKEIRQREPAYKYELADFL